MASEGARERRGPEPKRKPQRGPGTRTHLSHPVRGSPVETSSRPGGPCTQDTSPTPGREAERHFATVSISAVELKYCHGWRPAGQRVPSKTATGQRTCAKPCQKPSTSKVILRAVADKGTCKYVSLATLKKAVSTTGYDMARNAYHFKRVFKGLVDKGSAGDQQGGLGSFTLGKKQASKSKLKVKRQRQQRWRSGQRPFGQHRSLLGSKQGHKRLIKGVRRVAKCHCN
ncbi:LOW QUALITY PROTEIN: putative histone H1.9 [Pan paniscus]|uniref:LOW QUALITY PROTEIN: putative histone H1.9 n=1 Tax=Pan paniscus TaxID=9597 RepID=UPI002436B0F7|nr:LOW QUALITY PROTEIN: putative spermatid-specific linker histone H1-like protein [Pan paniscus]